MEPRAISHRIDTIAPLRLGEHEETQYVAQILLTLAPAPADIAIPGSANVEMDPSEIRR